MQVISSARADFLPAGKASDISNGQQVWLVTVLTTMTMLSTIDKNIMALLLDAIKRDLRISDTQISIMFSFAFAAVYTLAAIPAGWAADRWSRRRIAGGAGLLWSSMTMLCAMPLGYAGLLLSRMGVGLGEGMLGPSAQSLVCDGVQPRSRGRALAALALAPTLGAGSAMLLGGFVYSLFPASGLALPFVGLLHPWQLTLLVVGAFGIPISMLTWTVTECERSGLRLPAEGDNWGPALAHIRQYRNLYLPLLLIFLAQATITAIYGAWIPSVIKRTWGLTSWEIGKTTGLILLVFGPCGGWLASGLLGKIARRSDYRGFPVLAIVAALLCGTVSTSAVLVSDIRLFFVLFALMALFSIIPVANVYVAISRLTPPHIRGRVFGLQFLAAGLFALTLAPTIVAIIADYGFHDLGELSISAAVATACAAVTLISVISGVAIYGPYTRATADY